jgi:hypothetical protein
MASTLVLPGLPSSNGSTIIQTSNFANIGAHWSQISWEDAFRRVDALGREKFPFFPLSKPPVQQIWVFLERNNMPSGSENIATLIAARVYTRLDTLVPQNRVAGVTPSNLKSETRLADVTEYAVQRLTQADGQIYHNIDVGGAKGMVTMDPDTSTLIAPTSGYQASYEAMSMLYQAVAASVPSVTPLMKLVNGRHPLV